MSGSLRFVSVLAALFFGAPCFADNVTVTANPNMTFSPANVTIHIGDTVTFKNAGGYHNVVADDGSFRCSDSCGSAGNPSASHWQYTHTYTSAGSFGYYCEPHGNPGVGMHGTVVVEASTTAEPITLGGYLSGAWYDPEQSGHGFSLEFTQSNNTLVAIWFAFAPDGSGPYWIYGEGPYDTSKSTVTIPAILLTGAAFPPNFNKADVVKTPWGTMTFSFSDCNTAEVSWESTLSGYGNGTLPLVRLSQIAGTECPAQ
ncbi:MAG TPA: plastocyanin/azurin family copper-binding protein [Rhodanobacteraceae bacterium]|nr:plastocyanin/azurin family copper-binding protein [Rhodanobacteraceae bacterium]